MYVLENEDYTEHVWVYDCKERLYWFCYFALPCNDSVVRLRYLGNATTIDDDSQKERGFLQYLAGDLRRDLRARFPKFLSTCDLDSYSQFHFTAIAAQYIWRYSPATAQWMSSKMGSLRSAHGARYAAVQWRLTDKGSEYGPVTESLLLNTSYVAASVYAEMSARGLSVLFVATDDCVAYHRLKHKLRSVHRSSLRLFSTCSVLRNKGLAVRLGGYEPTLDLLLDVELMRNAELLVGSVYSNIVRMTYRLRYPNLSFVNLADEWCVLAKDHMTDSGNCFYIDGEAVEGQSYKYC